VRNGETEIGMTYHLMDETFDTGGIPAQKPVPLAEDEDLDSLWPKLGATSAELLPLVFERLARGETGEPQEGGEYQSLFDETHALDPVKGADVLGDQGPIEGVCDEAPDDVYQLEHGGAVFSRTEDGRIAQRPFGAAGEPRTAYAADITGHVLVQVMYEQVMK